jgi:hypothetical protein
MYFCLKLKLIQRVVILLQIVIELLQLLQKFFFFVGRLEVVVHRLFVY